MGQMWTYLVIRLGFHHPLTAYGTDGSCTVVAQDEVSDLLVIIVYEGTFWSPILEIQSEDVLQSILGVTGLHLDRSHIAYCPFVSSSLVMGRT